MNQTRTLFDFLEPKSKKQRSEPGKQQDVETKPDRDITPKDRQNFYKNCFKSLSGLKPKKMMLLHEVLIFLVVQSSRLCTKVTSYLVKVECSVQ